MLKKNILELLYWLPKINRYMFTKLSFLIIYKKLDISCVNQILDILMLKYDKILFYNFHLLTKLFFT